MSKINIYRFNLPHPESQMHFMNVFLASVFCLIAADAFSQQVSFRHLTIDDGLSQNAVYAILHDSRGFMWFGISVQFVSRMSAKTYNPDEERGAGNRLGLSFTDEIIKAQRGK